MLESSLGANKGARSDGTAGAGAMTSALRDGALRD